MQGCIWYQTYIVCLYEYLQIYALEYASKRGVRLESYQNTERKYNVTGRVATTILYFVHFFCFLFLLWRTKSQYQQSFSGNVPAVKQTNLVFYIMCLLWRLKEVILE